MKLQERFRLRYLAVSAKIFANLIKVRGRYCKISLLVLIRIRRKPDEEDVVGACHRVRVDGFVVSQGGVELGRGRLHPGGLDAPGTTPSVTVAGSVEHLSSV